MVPTQDKTFPLSVIETLIALTFMAFWCGVNVGMQSIGVAAWMYVVVNASIVCFALLVTYFGVEFDGESDPLLEYAENVEANTAHTKRALVAISEHTSSIKHLLMAKKDDTANETLAAILKILQTQENRYQSTQQHIKDMVFGPIPQLIEIGPDDTAIDPHLLDKNAPAIHPDDKAKLLTLPKRPVSADKPHTRKSQASKAAATPLPSAAAETE